MRTKRENTCGMPARILANADRGRIVPDANDCNDFQTAAVAADPPPDGPNCLQDANDCNGFQTAAVAADPRPRWPRPLAERAGRSRPQVAVHAQR